MSTPNLDLVFLMDCTGSMGAYIEAAKKSIRDIVLRITRSEKTSLRFALVAYRDHPPQDCSFITQSFPFTANLAEMQAHLDTLSAAGGGDGPEAVTAALAELEGLSWHPEATKVAVLIADAPPHGLGESGDGFPKGDPLGRDPLIIARQLASKGIVVYSVGCEPALGAYANARGFFVALAQVTQGQAVSLSSSGLLAEVILGGSLEEVGLQSLAQRYQRNMTELLHQYRSLGQDVSSPEVSTAIAQQLHSEMQAQQCQVQTLVTDGSMTDPRAEYFAQATSLDDAREQIQKKFGSPAEPSLMFSSVIGTFGFPSPCSAPGLSPTPTAPTSATTCASIASPVSVQQCVRLVNRSVIQTPK